MATKDLRKLATNSEWRTLKNLGRTRTAILPCAHHFLRVRRVLTVVTIIYFTLSSFFPEAFCCVARKIISFLRQFPVTKKKFIHLALGSV